MRALLLLATLLWLTSSMGQNQMMTDDVHVRFVSEAPLELITAETWSCSGIMDTLKKTFAFRVKIRSFEGFNSPLQREHFNENYMESDNYPYASFQGRFLDEFSSDQTENSMLRVKGILNIHGKEDERVIHVTLSTDEKGSLLFESFFEVQLETHGIDVPRIVYQKIAETIDVTVKGKFN